MRAEKPTNRYANCCIDLIKENTLRTGGPSSTIAMGAGLELSDSRGLVKSYDTFDVGRCQTVRRRAVGMPRIGV